MKTGIETLALASMAFALAAAPYATARQQAVRLTVKVTLTGAAGAATPVTRHTLFVSEDPPTVAPSRLVTASDGTARLNVRPGRYVVESDQPLAFEGRAYSWIVTVDVAAGGETVLELNAGNAEVGAIADAPPGARATPPEPDASTLLLRWQHHVVALWTPTVHASGFVIDPRGLVATSRRAIRDASSVEVQFTATTKVAGTVVTADANTDVAIVRVHPSALASVPVVSTACGREAALPESGAEVIAMGVSLRGMRSVSTGEVTRADPSSTTADVNVRGFSPGGPLFAADGSAAGLVSLVAAEDRYQDDVPIVALADVCAVVRSLERALDEAPPPATLLPVEPAVTIDTDALEQEASRRAGSLAPYAMSSEDFDIRFITPVMAYHALQQGATPAASFSNWSEYVRGSPAVLLVRVTPKQTESFWMKLARGAAWTQGAALPPITRFKPGFARLRAFCGETEVTPIHAFRLEWRLTETEAVREGLVVFAPDAIGPDCGRARLVLTSEKAPDRTDTREIAPDVLKRIRQDLAAYLPPR